MNEETTRRTCAFRASCGFFLLAPFQRKSAARDDIVLSASKSGQVVCRTSRIEVTNFAPQPNPSPEAGIRASAKIECSPMYIAWRRIRAAVHLKKTLLVE